MASSTSFKASPSLTRSTSYEAWLKELQIRESFTDIPGDKRGSAVFLSLEGKARQAALELEVEQINNKDGIKNIVAKLDKLYLKDKTLSAYEAYDNFEHFKRPSDMSMSDYINNKKRSHTQLDSRKQVIAFQDRVITINIKEAQHPLK